MDMPMTLAVIAVVSAWVVLFLAIRRWGPGRGKRRVVCPELKRRAKVTVTQGEGDFGSLRVIDVTACSLFSGAPLACGKECLPQL